LSLPGSRFASATNSATVFVPTDGFGADVAARPRPVLDDDGRLPVLRHLLAERARKDVDARARRERHDDPDARARVGILRRGVARRGDDEECCDQQRMRMSHGEPLQVE
jgi:hypothetical protein